MPVTAVLFLCAAAYAAGLVRLWRSAGVGQGIGRGQAAAFGAGILILLIALVGLHRVSEELLVAHMVQHELLMIVSAPLMALGSPLVAWLWLAPSRWRYGLAAGARRSRIAAACGALGAPVAAWGLFSVALWAWHVPSLYQAALRSDAVHIVEHLSFFLTAVLFWSGLRRGRYGRLGYGAAVVFVFATAVHSGVLGALLTFSRTVWYPAYAQSPAASGLTALEDQQLAGLVMWVPAGILLTAGALIFLAAWIRESERRARFAGDRASGRTSPTHLLVPAVACVSLASLLGSACGSADVKAAAEMTGGDPGRGRVALHRYGCDSCHQIPGIDSSAGRVVGPPLTSIARRVYVAGHLPNTPPAMEEWIRHPRNINPHTAMPDTGVTDTDARDMAAYLYTLR